jgi:hypothetical protein
MNRDPSCADFSEASGRTAHTRCINVPIPQIFSVDKCRIENQVLMHQEPFRLCLKLDPVVRIAFRVEVRDQAMEQEGP